MKPTFKDRLGYKQWRKEFRHIYNILSLQIVELKKQARNAQRSNDANHPKLQKELHYKRIMAYKLNGLLLDAKARRDRIITIINDMKKLQMEWPLSEDNCRHIDFHFNKAHLEFPFIPMWTVKTKGRSIYVNHVEATVAFSTKETPENSHTKGAIRFRNCNLYIDKNGVAKITACQINQDV